MLCESQAVRSWPLERYAKFIARNEAHSTQAHKQGYWKQFSPAPDGCSCLQVSLLPSNMVVSDGKIIHLASVFPLVKSLLKCGVDHTWRRTLAPLKTRFPWSQSGVQESFSLFNAKKWLQAVVKGDSMLIIYKMNNDSRRFRIKFSKSLDRSAMENCRQFISEISPQIPVREISAGACNESDSQVQMEDSQLISPESQHAQVSRAAGASAVGSSTAGASVRGLTLPDLANKISSSESSRDVPQPAGQMGVPQDRINLLIRLCLTDSNFPAFVEAVEKELSNLTSSEPS